MLSRQHGDPFTLEHLIETVPAGQFNVDPVGQNTPSIHLGSPHVKLTLQSLELQHAGSPPAHVSVLVKSVQYPPIAPLLLQVTQTPPLPPELEPPPDVVRHKGFKGALQNDILSKQHGEPLTLEHIIEVVPAGQFNVDPIGQNALSIHLGSPHVKSEVQPSELQQDGSPPIQLSVLVKSVQYPPIAPLLVQVTHDPLLPPDEETPSQTGGGIGLLF